ncbi:UNVERIFIED_CONTAM: hypothetical protein Sradi_7043900 [Sesamum radiatum]|uniref:Uncharacterized protein n=1 Tax=Sesamum radiatum TaxID=300843 RepID=A0AAW2J8N1_SESRA
MARWHYFVGGSHSTFVRGEYSERDSKVGKKMKVTEAGPSRCSPLKEGEHSPRVVGFCCIGRMQELMDKRWGNAQQVCGAELRELACGKMFIKKDDYEVGKV